MNLDPRRSRRRLAQIELHRGRDQQQGGSDEGIGPNNQSPFLPDYGEVDLVASVTKPGHEPESRGRLEWWSRSDFVTSGPYVWVNA